MPVIWLIAATLAASTDCPRVYEQVADATEANYGGYVVKLSDEKARGTYRRFRTLLRQDAERATGHAACRAVLQRYTAYFADHHLFVSSRGNVDSPLPNASMTWSARRLQRHFRKTADSLDRVEGAWYDSSGRIAVVRDPAASVGGAAGFLAFRVAEGGKTTPMARLRRSGSAYLIDYRHESQGWQQATAELRRQGSLLAFGTTGWGRPGSEYLDPVDPMAPLARSIAPGLVYVSLPSFMPHYRQPLKALLGRYDEAVSRAHGLIVDVRGNAGGDAIYFPLAHWFLDRELVVSKPSSVRASPWTIDHFASLRERLGEQGAWLDQPLARMRANPGKVVPFRDGSSEGLPEYPAAPRSVAVLQDRGTGSAAEAFVFHTRQSGKVVTMGEPTRGNIDYMQVSMHPVGEAPHAFWFGYPLYFARSLPQGSIDDEGYAPDVHLGAAAGDPIDFARRWLQLHTSP